LLKIVDHPPPPEFRFCPVCGGRLSTLALKAGEPARLVCSRCDFVFYQDPKVVACVILELEGKILLLRRAIDPQKGLWVMPGGYVDRGEVVAQAAMRETEEECGLKTALEGLVGVYSYPGKTEVIVVYKGRRIGGEPAAGDETSEVGLFPPGQIPWDEIAFQSTEDALKDYLRNHCGRRENGP
jgi:ADP-ribose pyrophosphatase YjhB (NUDIX family)